MNETSNVHNKKPLRIVAFLDGRPGHEKQTKSILTAIAKITPVTILFNNVQTGSFKRGLFDWVRYYGFCLRSWIFASQQNQRRDSFDLIIGAGAFTHIPMIRLQKSCGAKAVTCMSPAYPLLREFDLCLIPRHDRQPSRKNIIVTQGPPIFTSARGMHNPGKGLILVGGVDKRSHKWRTDTLIEHIRVILQRESNKMWTLSSSPRTPSETVDAMAQLMTNTDNVHFYRAEDTPAGWIEIQYQKHHAVWVTADSISMIFEAITAGCRVGILPVEWKHTQSKFKACVDDLIQNHWATSFESWRAGKKDMIHDRDLNEAARCAGEILRRWWPDRLPSSKCFPS